MTETRYQAVQLDDIEHIHQQLQLDYKDLLLS